MRQKRTRQKLRKIRAFDPNHQVTVMMEFVSIAEAQYHNKHLIDFQYV